MEIPEEILARRDLYCQKCGCSIRELRGWGMEAFIWQTEEDDILKVHRTPVSYHIERDVYLRLSDRGLEKLQGFRIPHLMHYDDETLVLQLSYLKPPYILDFGAATLDRPPAGFDPESEDWNAEQSRKFGRDWPDVKRLLDALRQYGIHYPDVHTQNIRVRA